MSVEGNAKGASHPHGQSLEDDLKDEFEKLAEELREQGATDLGYRIPIGTPCEEILNAGGNRADALVVMGTHGRGLLPGVVLGSVGRQVVRRASARVLLLPADEADAE